MPVSKNIPGTKMFSRPKTVEEAKKLKKKFLEYEKIAIKKNKFAEKKLKENIKRLKQEIEDEIDLIKKEKLSDDLGRVEEIYAQHKQNMLATKSFFRRGKQKIDQRIADLEETITN